MSLAHVVDYLHLIETQSDNNPVLQSDFTTFDITLCSQRFRALHDILLTLTLPLHRKNGYTSLLALLISP